MPGAAGKGPAVRTSIIIALLLLWSGRGEGARGGEDRAAPGTREVTSFFAGKVTKWKARRIRLVYDFSDAKQLADFTETNPFRTEGTAVFTVKDGALHARGSGALVSRALFERDLSVSFTVVSPDPRDIGAILLDPASPEPFLLFALADCFFSRRDRQPLKQHMITVVGAEDGGRPGAAQFRYLRRTRKPELPAGGAIEVTVRKVGERNRFVFAGWTMDASDRYARFAAISPGLYVLDSGLKVTRLEIAGKLAVPWLEKHRIGYDPKEVDDEAVPELEPPKGNVVPVPDPGSSGGGPRRGPGRGGGRSSSPVRRLGDPGLSRAEREKAADELGKENVRLAELRGLIDALYSSDLLTRKLAIRVLKKVTGKTLGYRPEAPERDRRKAIARWFRYLMRNRDRYR